MWALHHWLPLGHWIAAPCNRIGSLPADAGDGVFRISRNPMCLGLLLLLIGWAQWLGSARAGAVPGVPAKRASVDRATRSRR